MKDYLIIEITNRINQIAKNDGVHASANLNPDPITRTNERVRVWDINLTYSNYHYVERFNEGMAITDDAIDHIAISLLKTLFTDYFEAKLSYA